MTVAMNAMPGTALINFICPPQIAQALLDLRVLPSPLTKVEAGRFQDNPADAEKRLGDLLSPAHVSPPEAGRKRNRSLEQTG
jgi:hypothetical protein